MSRHGVWLAALLLCELGSSRQTVPARHVTKDATPSVTRATAFATDLPLAFESNQGQVAAGAQFVARVPGAVVSLNPEGATFTLSDRPAPLRLRLLGSNPYAPPEILERLPGKVNYFRGSDAGRWRADVPTCARVRYADVYPGIDIVYYGTAGQLEYDFIVKPGGDAGAIRMTFDGAARLDLDRHGDLIIETGSGELHQRRPAVYQLTAGRKEPVRGRYVLTVDHTVGFEVDGAKGDATLVIDPILTYSSYVGGSGTDAAVTMTIDTAGNIYLAGYTQSADFVTTASAARPGGSRDAFVMKLNPTASTILYSTFLGGSASDKATAIAVDPSGNVFVAGETSSTDFPTTEGAFDRRCGGDASAGLDCGQVHHVPSTDAFVAKIAADGATLTYATFLGGSGADVIGYNGDSAGGLAVDAQGNVYVTGWTSSPDFPTTAGAFDRSCGIDGLCNAQGVSDAFVAKLNPAGSALVYSTYLGGGQNDNGTGIVVDTAGTAYVTGETSSSDFPLANPVQRYGGGFSDAFVVKVDAAGSSLLYSTFLGGTGSECGSGVVIDTAGFITVSGTTTSIDFPTVNAWQSTYGGDNPAQWSQGNAFVTRLTPRGDAVVYSTYYGGKGTFAKALTIDAASNVYLAGSTRSDAGICAEILGTPVPCLDAFVLVLNPRGGRLSAATFGGGRDDAARAIGLNPAGHLLIVGVTSSPDFPLKGGIQSIYRGEGDAFIAMLSPLLTITRAGGGTVTSTPPGLNCGTSCSVGLGMVTVSLFAEPAPGFVFAGWGGDADCLDGRVTMTVDRSCSATFVSTLADAPMRGVLDLNGDRAADVLTYDPRTGHRSLELGDRSGHFSSVQEVWSPDWLVHPADFNGDGLTDIFLYRRDSPSQAAAGARYAPPAPGTWLKAINNGHGDFEYASGRWDTGWTIVVADLDANRRSDLFLYNESTGVWIKCYTTDPRADFRYVSGRMPAGLSIHAVDLDSDRRADVFAYRPGSGEWLWLANDTDAGLRTVREGTWSPNWQIDAGDFNGDGRFDLFLFNPQTRQWAICTNAVNDFVYAGGSWESGSTVTVLDLNGDERSDVFVYDSKTGVWIEAITLDGMSFRYAAGVWSPGWQIAATDFNADRRSDLLLYNDRTGQWVQAINTGIGTFSYGTGFWDSGLTVVGDARRAR